jgi:RNA ligase (TIGR02306 family)
MKIATIERITSVRHHPNADRLDLVSVLGYQCVTSRDSFLSDHLVIFIQPDSVLPTDQTWAQSYLKYARPRVRAIKFRNEWSEGLILPLTDNEKDLKEGDSVAEQLGIKHFEPVITQDPTVILGPLPFGIPKTDEERVENLGNDLPWNELVDITKKIDGTSCSVYYSLKKKQFGICGRNCEYDLTKSNNFTHIVSKYSLKECLTQFCEQKQLSLVLRGELYGGNIQKKANNPHSTQPLQWAIFSVYLIRNETEQGRYTRRKTDDLLYSIKLAEHLNLPHVPVIESQVPLTQQLITKYSSEVDITFGEGVVIQHDYGSFKIINKNYDAKN